jgi:hypothetical protein
MAARRENVGRIVRSDRSAVPGTVVARFEIDEPESHLRPRRGVARPGGRLPGDGRFSILLTGRYEIASPRRPASDGTGLIGVTEDLEDMSSCRDSGDGRRRRFCGPGVPGAWVTSGRQPRRGFRRDPDDDRSHRREGRYTASTALPSSASRRLRRETRAQLRSLWTGTPHRWVDTIRLERGRRIAESFAAPTDPRRRILVSGSGHAVETGNDGTSSTGVSSRDDRRPAAISAPPRWSAGPPASARSPPHASRVRH